MMTPKPTSVAMGFRTQMFPSTLLHVSEIVLVLVPQPYFGKDDDGIKQYFLIHQLTL